MAIFYSIPEWFFFLGVGLEIIFAVIAGSAAAVAFSIYRYYKERSIRTLAFGFASIALAYLIWASMHIILTSASGNVLNLNINNAIILQVVSAYAFMALFLTGLVALAYATFGVQKGELFYLLLGLSFTVIAASLNKLVTFRIVSVFLLAFLVYQYFKSIKSGNKKTKPMLAAFTMLLFANITYVFLPTDYHSFIIGHVLELAAYTLVLTTLVKSIKQKNG